MRSRRPVARRLAAVVADLPAVVERVAQPVVERLVAAGHPADPRVVRPRDLPAVLRVARHAVPPAAAIRRTSDTSVRQ